MVKQLLAMSIFGMSMFNPTQQASPSVLAQHAFSLEDRYANTTVNDVFKDNILLTLGYMREKVVDKKVVWKDIEKPFTYTFTLDPHQTFAFHTDVLPEYKDSVAKTTEAHFSADEGFKSDGYLYGDGVCHLASLINWTAKDAGLAVNAPTNHNFAAIPDVPQEYGTAIYDDPGNVSTSAAQNLYITNNKDKPVEFSFEYHDNALAVSIRL